jgi:hypothetical protein
MIIQSSNRAVILKDLMHFSRKVRDVGLDFEFL